MKISLTITAFILLFAATLNAQTSSISGYVISGRDTIQSATVLLAGANAGRRTDSSGNYNFYNLDAGMYKIKVSAVGYLPFIKVVTLNESENAIANFELSKTQGSLGEVVVTGTLKEVRRKLFKGFVAITI
jgi:outer membrane receptor for ferrienterochelin and colicins